ncbi:MAG: FMN-binding protein [Eubacteriaceae bacterium]
MKKVLKIVGILSVILFIMLTVTIMVVNSLDLPEIEISENNLYQIKDGNYKGNYSSGLVKVEVNVSVANHKINKIEILKHENGLGKKAEKIVDKIIERQSLDVDVISGATISSNTIKKAVQLSLGKED